MYIYTSVGRVEREEEVEKYEKKKLSSYRFSNESFTYENFRVNELCAKVKGDECIEEKSLLVNSECTNSSKWYRVTLSTVSAKKKSY